MRNSRMINTKKKKYEFFVDSNTDRYGVAYSKWEIVQYSDMEGEIIVNIEEDCSLLLMAR